FTGGTAEIEPKVDEEYIAWDGYIWGKTLELVPHSRIVQSWRTAEFNDDDPDSKIVVEMEQVGGMSTLTLTHTNLQPGQGVKYEQGWEDSYFAPMRDYYTEKYQ
ncbi:MAG: SRPBCC domain-containing protein, partial [Chloroflexota bacterium]